MRNNLAFLWHIEPRRCTTYRHHSDTKTANMAFRL